MGAGDTEPKSPGMGVIREANWWEGPGGGCGRYREKGIPLLLQLRVQIGNGTEAGVVTQEGYMEDEDSEKGGGVVNQEGENEKKVE